MTKPHTCASWHIPGMRFSALSVIGYGLSDPCFQFELFDLCLGLYFCNQAA